MTIPDVTIPEDIDETACAAFYEAWDDGHPFPIARAILAERQRCADIAKKVAEDAYGDTSAIGVAATIMQRIVSH